MLGTMNSINELECASRDSCGSLAVLPEGPMWATGKRDLPTCCHTAPGNSAGVAGVFMHLS